MSTAFDVAALRAGYPQLDRLIRTLMVAHVDEHLTTWADQRVEHEHVWSLLSPGSYFDSVRCRICGLTGPIPTGERRELLR